MDNINERITNLRKNLQESNFILSQQNKLHSIQRDEYPQSLVPTSQKADNQSSFLNQLSRDHKP